MQAWRRHSLTSRESVKGTGLDLDDDGQDHRAALRLFIEVLG
jgi:hypothetical protein